MNKDSSEGMIQMLQDTILTFFLININKNIYIYIYILKNIFKNGIYHLSVKKIKIYEVYIEY